MLLRLTRPSTVPASSGRCETLSSMYTTCCVSVRSQVQEQLWHSDTDRNNHKINCSYPDNPALAAHVFSFDCKIWLITFKAPHGRAPEFLSERLSSDQPVLSLRQEPADWSQFSFGCQDCCVERAVGGSQTSSGLIVIFSPTISEIWAPYDFQLNWVSRCSIWNCCFWTFTLLWLCNLSYK